MRRWPAPVVSVGCIVRFLRVAVWGFVDAYQVFRDFYYSLGMPLRVVIEYRLRRRGVSLSDVFSKPWLLTKYVAEEMGGHNAELIAALFVEYVRKLGVDTAVAWEALRGEEGWARFVSHVERL